LATIAETGMCKKPRLVMSAYIMDIGCLEAAQPMTDDGYSSPRYVRLDLPDNNASGAEDSPDKFETL
jgi:hypothetical protein